MDSQSSFQGDSNVASILPKINTAIFAKSEEVRCACFLKDERQFSLSTKHLLSPQNPPLYHNLIHK